jgi:hypothetical protein
MNLITIRSCLVNNACYSVARLRQLDPTDEGLTPLQVAELPIPADDRHWALVHASGALPRILREHACWCARRALALVKDPDPRSVHAVEVAERFARGEATYEELLEARDAAFRAFRSANLSTIAEVSVNVCNGSSLDAAEKAPINAAVVASYTSGQYTYSSIVDAKDKERVFQVKDLAERLTKNPGFVAKTIPFEFTVFI